MAIVLKHGFDFSLVLLMNNAIQSGVLNSNGDVFDV
jgi:hypothetical protein